MKQLKMQCNDTISENIRKVLELFPSCVTEYKDKNDELKIGIDFDKLKQELSLDLINNESQRYQFTWPNKREASYLANLPTTNTLRPCREESVDFNNTKNLYIEGDNLEVLKCLRNTYLNSVKMIYIDPPYNTGKNIIYKNNFIEDVSSYISRSGLVDNFGNYLYQNVESSGRFHTDWLNMMYPLLKIAKTLLTNDGYIAIAIDDNELYNLKKITDEIFSESNYIGTIVTRSNPQGRGKNNIDPVHEYHLLYAKNIAEMPFLKINNSQNETNYTSLLRSGTNSRKNERPKRFYPILLKDGKLSMINNDEYSQIYSEDIGFNDHFIEFLKNKYENIGYTVLFPIAKNGEEKVWQRTFERVCTEISTYIYDNGQIKTPPEPKRTPISLWTDDIYSNVSNGTNKLKALFNSKVALFDFSKSIFTVKDLISLNTKDDDLILDFFSGSATTAQAVMQLNAEDNSSRKFIMVQIPEQIGKETEAYKAGYKNICEIGKERIRLSGCEIKEKLGKNYSEIDIGFRVLKLDSSNMLDVYYEPSRIDQGLLSEFNIKTDRTDEDLLFQVMLEHGIDLSSKIDKFKINSKDIFSVSDNFLLACFEDKIDDKTIEEIAKYKPYYYVMKNSSIVFDSVADNFKQIFKFYSKETICEVI